MSRIVFNDERIKALCGVSDIITKSVVAMEELAECQKEISKFVRGNGNKQNLAEEIADVYFTLAQIASIHSIPMMDIQEAIGIKMERQISRDSQKLNAAKFSYGKAGGLN